MQIMIPHEVIEGLVTSGILGVAGLISKYALKGVKGELVKEINEIVTQNTNRTRTEMISDFDAKHEENQKGLANHLDEDRREFKAIRDGNNKEFARINRLLDQLIGGR